MRSTLFVAGFGTRTRAADLAYEFERYGRLVRCDIPAPKKFSSKPYAFVEYEDPRDAEDAFNEMHGRRIDALTISVQWARNAPSASWRYNRSPPRDRRRSLSPNAPFDYPLPPPPHQYPADLSPPAPKPTYPADGSAPLSPIGRMDSPKDMPSYPYRDDGYRSPPPPMNQSYHRMPYPPPRRSSPPPYMRGRSRSPPPYHHHHVSGPPPPSRHSHYHRRPSYRQPYHHHRYLPDMDRRPDSPPSRRRYYSRSPPPPGPASSAAPYDYHQQRRRSYSPSPSRDDVRDTDLSSVSSSPSKSKYDHPHHHHPYHHHQQHHHRLYRPDRSLSGSPPSYRRPVSPAPINPTNDGDALDSSVARSPSPAYGQRSPSPPVLEY